MIKDVVQACQKLNVKAIKALDFCDKWKALLQRTISGSNDVNLSENFSMIEDQFELIRFSKEVKKKQSKQ